MTDQELRGLSKRDLIDILCQLKKEEAAIIKENQALKSQLDDRKIKIEKAGTLADAVIAINGVLEATQNAADQYLEQIQKLNEEVENNCREMMNQTRENCLKQENEANMRINEKWRAFDQKIKKYMSTHSEFESIMENKKE